VPVASQEVVFMWVEQTSCFRTPHLSLLLAVEITSKTNWHVSVWFWLVVVLGILFFCYITFLMHKLLNFYLLRKYKGGKSKFCVISVCLCA